ncbi:hypothetical protein BHM03_00053776 [Ensete ventricosum]|nr:hypothetical protein BHM03_00053776 [Ensete ventricosum]
MCTERSYVLYRVITNVVWLQHHEPKVLWDGFVTHLWHERRSIDLRDVGDDDLDYPSQSLDLLGEPQEGLGDYRQTTEVGHRQGKSGVFEEAPISAGVWETELPSPRWEKRNNGAAVGANCPPVGVSSLRLLSIEHSCDIGSLSSVRILLMAHVVAEVSV